MSRWWGGTFCRAPAPCFQVRLSILLHLRCSEFILLCRFERRVGRAKKRPLQQPGESIIDFSSPSQDHPLGADQHHTFDPPDASDRPNKRPKTKEENETKAKTTGENPQQESASGSLPSNRQQPATSAPPPVWPGPAPATIQKKLPVAAAAAPRLQGPYSTSSTSIGTSGTSIGTSSTSIGKSSTSIGTSGTSIGTSGTSIGKSGTSIGTSGTSIDTSDTSIFDIKAPPELVVPSAQEPSFHAFPAAEPELHAYPGQNHPNPAPERVTDNPGVSYPHPSQNP